MPDPTAPAGASSNPVSASPVVITVCTTCRVAGGDEGLRPGAELAARLENQVAGSITVRRTQCLSVCRRVCTAALSGEGRYTFLFGDLEPGRDETALLAMAAAMVEAPMGFVPWKDRPEGLRSRILARIPPLEWSPPDGSSPA